MSEPVVIRVLGQPAPQGSKKAFAIRKGGQLTGRVAVVESSDKKVKSWRADVVSNALDVIREREQLFTDGGLRFPLDGPLDVAMTFYLPRPQGHYGTGRNTGTLRDSAPAYPSGRPDSSKLLRATEDALTTAGIYRDDAQIVTTRLAKRYADGGLLPGVHIVIEQLT